VLGGGHSATGFCLNTGGVLLDMSFMKGMCWIRNNAFSAYRGGRTLKRRLFLPDERHRPDLAFHHKHATAKSQPWR
jgi:FAD/FMN-containing dehydrogenase